MKEVGTHPAGAAAAGAAAALRRQHGPLRAQHSACERRSTASAPRVEGAKSGRGRSTLRTRAHHGTPPWAAPASWCRSTRRRAAQKRGVACAAYASAREEQPCSALRAIASPPHSSPDQRFKLRRRALFKKKPATTPKEKEAPQAIARAVKPLSLMKGDEQGDEPRDGRGDFFFC